MKYFTAPILIMALVFLVGCASSPAKPVTLDPNWPRSILVMPPLNHSIEVNAPYTYLSTITQPLAEKGYYVFPVAVIDQLLKDNGLPTPDEMNGIPLDKIRLHTGADAVLYCLISDWGQKFQVISSSTVVSVQLRLVDTRTGAELWQAKVHGHQNSNNSSGGGLLGAVVSAVANQVAGSISDNTPQLARSANRGAIYGGSNRLPDGYYRFLKHPEP
jgi:hypothetical protein